MHKTSPPPQPGTVLKNLYMKPSKLSTTNLAKQLNVTPKTISDVINNRARITLDHNQKLPSLFKNKQKADLLIGCTPLYPPVELFAAMGLQPVVLWNLKSLITNLNEADLYVQSYTCGIARELVQFILSDSGKFLDGIFTYNACDTIRNLPEIIAAGNQKKKRKLPILRMHVPQANRAYTNSNQYIKDQIASLIENIQTAFNLSFSGLQFEQTVSAYQKMRELCVKAERMVAENALSFRAFSNKVLSNSFLPVDEQIQRLNQLITNPAAPQNVLDRRVMISGIMPPPQNVIRSIEESGLRVVANDIAVMGRSYSYSPQITADPQEYYLDFFNNRFPCTTLLYQTDVRLKTFFQMVEKSHVEGVIFSGEKFCEYEYLEFPYIEQKLKDMGIPVLNLEFSVDDSQNVESYITRVHAFSEMLNK
jgi:addiction module HigA family antidote